MMSVLDRDWQNILRVGLFGVAVISLVGCSAGARVQQGSSASSLGVTNAPAPGFESMQVGSEEDFMLNVGRRTYFTKGSAKLDDTAMETLNAQANWLTSHPQWKIKLQGFADDPGSEKKNKSLSTKRAEAVLKYLSDHGVPADRMWAKGYGRDRLVRDCNDITCKSQNRRVITNLRETFDAAAR